MKVAQNEGKLRYHMKCKNDFVQFVEITKKSAKVSKAETESAMVKKRHTCSEFSAFSGYVGLKVHGQFSSCIKMYAFFANNLLSFTKIMQQKPKYRMSDNLTRDKLKASLLKTAQSLSDDWELN